MQRRHDPTFYLATRRLPRDVRPGIHAVYGFVRGADELVDGPGRAPDPAGRRAALDAWERDLQAGVAAGASTHPVMAAIVDAGPRHGLPLARLADYMDAMRIDCGTVRMATEADLDRYMDGSAATVGRIMAPLLGAPDLGEPLARLGVAFQLTNFIRDVREDWVLDRVYLPGVGAEAIDAGLATPAVREQVARQVERARALFAATAGIELEMARAIRPGVRLARGVYERVLDRVEAERFDVLRRRVRPAPWHLGAAAAEALLR